MTWSYGKMALLVEAKIFSYKIIVILCHNVNFDVTIMTSWRHFFRSTLGLFCRQIISRKSHRRNFFNLLPFKSYKQKSKSWVISPPPLYRIRVNSCNIETADDINCSQDLRVRNQLTAINLIMELLFTRRRQPCSAYRHEIEACCHGIPPS